MTPTEWIQSMTTEELSDLDYAIIHSKEPEYSEFLDTVRELVDAGSIPVDEVSCRVEKVLSCMRLNLLSRTEILDATLPVDLFHPRAKSTVNPQKEKVKTPRDIQRHLWKIAKDRQHLASLLTSFNEFLQEGLNIRAAESN